MHASQVTFRSADVPVTTPQSGEEQRKMDIIEIRYPDGKVSAFPADAISPESGHRYRDIYAGKYRAFKDGKPDPDRVAQLEREIKERQAELDAMNGKPKDDERLQENLGYGDQTGANEEKAVLDHQPKLISADPGKQDWDENRGPKLGAAEPRQEPVKQPEPAKIEPDKPLGQPDKPPTEPKPAE